jgi:hypothetical protein
MRSLALLLFCTINTLSVQADMCSDIDGASIYSDEPSPVYLGFFGNSFAIDSAINPLGIHGSIFSDSGVYNMLGYYGSNFSETSANNSLAINPPIIKRWGTATGYKLTNNSFVRGGISLTDIKNCGFYFTSPELFSDYPQTVSASDDLFDIVSIAWSESKGTDTYKLYYSLSEFSERIFIQETAYLQANVSVGEPDVDYYFWVTANNGHGESEATFDLGRFIIDKVTDTDEDGVPDYLDIFPLDPDENEDTDLDNIGNNADLDDDGDGYSDIDEIQWGTDPLNKDDFPIRIRNPWLLKVLKDKITEIK